MGLALVPEKPAEAYQPTELEKKLVERVRERISAPTSRGTRYALERSWFECILFYQGIQWLDWNPTQRVFLPMRGPRWFPRPMTNEIMPRAERLFAQFLKGRPAARVRPNSNDPADRAAAHSGEYLLAHIDDVVNENYLRHLAAVVVTLTGTVISREYYDPNAGPIVEYPDVELAETPIMGEGAACPECDYEGPAEQMGQPCPECAKRAISGGMMGDVLTSGPIPTLESNETPQLGPDGQPLMQLEQRPKLNEAGEPIVDRFHEGAVRSEIIMPFSFYWDENAPTLDQAEWAGHTAFKSLAWIQRTFPEKGKYVTEATDQATYSFYESALLNLVGPSLPDATGQGGRQQTGGAVVTYMEERPSEEFPDGLALIVAGNVLLWQGPVPIQQELSYSEMVYSLVPGRLPGATVIEQMVPIQRRLNGIDAQIVLNQKLMLNPVWLIPKGSGVKPEQIQHRPGLHIAYNAHGAGGAKPEIVPGVQLPAQIMELRSLLLDALERISATQDVLRGDVPSGVKSGVALNFLGESAETTHLPRMQRWEHWIAARGRKRLLLVKRHYRTERMVKVLGQGSSWQVQALSGADLRDNTDVVVEAGSALPRSRTAQIQLIFDALETGILGDVNADPVLRQKVQEALGLSGFEGDMGADYLRAQMENALMDQGQLPDVGEYEDLELHIKVHTQEMKHPRFEDKTPAAQQAYENHVMQTRRKWLLDMQRQLLSKVLLGQQQDPNAPGPGGESPELPAPPEMPAAPAEGAAPEAPTGPSA